MGLPGLRNPRAACVGALEVGGLPVGGLPAWVRQARPGRRLLVAGSGCWLSEPGALPSSRHLPEGRRAKEAEPGGWRGWETPALLHQGEERGQESRELPGASRHMLPRKAQFRAAGSHSPPLSATRSGHTMDLEDPGVGGCRSPGGRFATPQRAEPPLPGLPLASCSIHLKQQKGAEARAAMLGRLCLCRAVYNSRMRDSQKETPNRTSCG